MESDYSINPAGFTIHSAVHAAREDALCVMHLHTEYGIAVSAQEKRAYYRSRSSRCLSWRRLVITTTKGSRLNDEEKPRLVADLGKKTFLILHNHR